MKKKIYQIITIVLLIILLAGINSKSLADESPPTVSEGGGGSQFTLDKIMTDGDNFLSAGQQGNRFKEGSIKSMIQSIYSILVVIGIIAAVIVGLILSIKFITGSIEEQAKVKEMLIPYVVGCVVIVLAFTIWKVVVDLLQEMQSVG